MMGKGKLPSGVMPAKSRRSPRKTLLDMPWDTGQLKHSLRGPSAGGESFPPLPMLGQSLPF